MENRITVYFLFLLFALTACVNDDVRKTQKSTGKKINGKKQGEWKTYYVTGTLCSVENYLNDTLNGTSITFNENGKIYTRAKYKNGKLVDSLIHYFSNGNINFIELRDSTGKLHGPIKVYFPNGTLKQFAYYKDGKADSVWVEYDEKGRELKRDFYENSRLVK